MVILATYADGDGMNCFPSVDTLMSDVGTDRRAVQRDLRGLEKDGYIACVVNEKGRGKTKGYLLKIQTGKGRQIPLDMGGTNTTIYKDEKGGKTAPHNGPQRAVKGSVKGGKTTSPIRSTSITSKNIEPLQGEPAGNLPCSGTENSPEDLPSISFAHRVAEELCLPQRENGLLDSVAGAIDFCVKFEGETKSSATESLIARARDEIDHGGAPTRFWFTDRKWRNGNGNAAGTSKADKRSAEVRNGTRAVFDAARSVLGHNPGRIQEQALPGGTAVMGQRALSGGGSVLDSGTPSGNGRDGKKSALVRG